MDSNSSENLEAFENSDENQVNDDSGCQKDSIGVDYFDCKICFSTVTIDSEQENIDPNLETSDICKTCKTNQKFKSTITEDMIEDSSASAKSLICSSRQQETNNTSSEESLMSPLSGRSTSSDINVVGIFAIGITHRVAEVVKAPKNASNFDVMNLYQSTGVYNSELEHQLSEGNEKRIEKFYAGVDVIFKADRKVFSCLPLLCPAKVYYDAAAGGSECEVIVGIIYDGHNSAIPVIALYDSFHQFKNFSKTRGVIHTQFARFKPTSIEHDFSPEELNLFSIELSKFLNIKSALEEKAGKLFNTI